MQGASAARAGRPRGAAAGAAPPLGDAGGRRRRPREVVDTVRTPAAGPRGVVAGRGDIAAHAAAAAPALGDDGVDPRRRPSKRRGRSPHATCPARLGRRRPRRALVLRRRSAPALVGAWYGTPRRRRLGRREQRFRPDLHPEGRVHAIVRDARPRIGHERRHQGRRPCGRRRGVGRGDVRWRLSERQRHVLPPEAPCLGAQFLWGRPRSSKPPASLPAWSTAATW
mmetsp:Transcript_86088/g.239599  ORF Transcript_86088/g.239599 Transcript_86088/m.239599 type:complete len:225 (+) Transcript_86088:416-1090(+)